MNTFDRVMLVGILLGIALTVAFVYLGTKCATMFGTGVCVW